MHNFRTKLISTILIIAILLSYFFLWHNLRTKKNIYNIVDYSGHWESVDVNKDVKLDIFGENNLKNFTFLAFSENNDVVEIIAYGIIELLNDNTYQYKEMVNPELLFPDNYELDLTQRPIILILKNEGIDVILDGKAITFVHASDTFPIYYIR